MLGNLDVNSVMNVAQKVSEPGKLEVVVVGIGTVFVGLICIVVICKIMSLCCGAKKGKVKHEESAATPVKVAAAPIQNREEIVAAVCAAAAEELGTDVSAIRVRSFKRI